MPHFDKKLGLLMVGLKPFKNIIIETKKGTYKLTIQKFLLEKLYFNKKHVI